MRKFNFNKMQTGLWDRFTGMFAPKSGKRIEADKLALIEILFNGILILGAIRVVDAMLIVNAGMPPVLRYGVAIATLILTEGGLIIWRAFRYKKTANKTQRDIAMFGMGTSFLASLAIGVSDYIGAAVGDNALTVGGANITGHSLMVFVTGGFSEGVDLTVIQRNRDGAEQALVAGEAVDRHTRADLRSKTQAVDVVLVAQLHAQHLPVIGLDGQRAVIVGADGAVEGAGTRQIGLRLYLRNA